MAQLSSNFQSKLKSSSAGFATWLLKVFSGFVLGLTLALMGEEVFSYGNFSFILVISVTVLIFLRLTKLWRWIPVVVFDLVMVLIGLLLRMYILIAPGA